MSDVSWKTKVMVCAKALYRDPELREQNNWHDWRQAAHEIQHNCAKTWIEACYDGNKEDPDVNLEVNEEVH